VTGRWDRIVQALQKPLRSIAGLLLLAAVSSALLMVMPVSSSSAQERYERRSVIDLIFGPRRSQEFPPPPPPRAQPAPQQQQPARRRASPQAPSGGQTRQAATPAAPIVEKAEDARTVLVIGDFMASGLAEGLQEAFANSANVVVVSNTNGSSGLVRDDFYSWPANLPTILEETEPAALVVMLGSNDRQQLSTANGAADLLTDAWKREYAARVDALAAIAETAEVPLIWVGAPAFQSPRMSADILAINQIYRDQMEAAEADFVDIWDGFVDEGGAFITTGSDIQGQQVRLRGSDGINMTAAGKRKLAFYAERPLRRLLEGTASATVADIIRADDALIGEVERPRIPELVTRTAPISITDPALDGATTLLGNGETYAEPELRSPRDRLVEEGLAAAAPAGRADDFRWPRRAVPPPAARGADARPTPVDAAPRSDERAAAAGEIGPGLSETITAN
jgi:uncharacterized protein